MTETSEKSLLRCTLKKSYNVTKKLVAYALYIVIGIGAVVVSCYGAVGIWSVIADPIMKSIAAIVSFVASIPWYYYVGFVAALSIPGYSFVWCVARELTDEDWYSNEAKTVALALAVALAGALALAVALASAVAVTLALAGALAVTLAGAVAVTLAFAGALAVTLALAVTDETKAFLFVGAYLHYRKRVKT